MQERIQTATACREIIGGSLKIHYFQNRAARETLLAAWGSTGLTVHNSVADLDQLGEQTGKCLQLLTLGRRRHAIYQIREPYCDRTRR
jgi:hypothetical protein